MGQYRIKIFLKNENKTNDIIKISKNGNLYNVIFKNYKTYTYNECDVKFVKYTEEEILIENRLNYFKKIAEKIGLEQITSKGNKINTLLKNYNSINEVNIESILYNFLVGEVPISPKKQNNCIEIFLKKINFFKEDRKDFSIFPFGFNTSQKNAVDYALENKVSVIEGPPGTGKTQTILNIIANAIIRGESVAVVSSNNSATKNIIDKLKKYDVDFVSAYLGNTENKEDFIKSQSAIPSIADWIISDFEIENIQKSLQERYKKLQEKLLQQKDLSKLKQILSELEVEYIHHRDFVAQYNIKEIPNEICGIKCATKALDMSFLVESVDKNNTNKLTKFIKKVLGIFNIKKYVKKIVIDELLEKYSKESLIALYQQRFYEIKISEIKNDIEKIEKDLIKFDFSKKMDEYIKLSAQIFKANLAKKYTKHNRKIYTINDLKLNSEEFIKDYPVILSTTYSLRSCLSNNVMYDYVIVDEASQVDLCTGVLALSCAKKAVIVGDLKQLPNVVDSKKTQITDEIFKNYNVPEVYRYKNHCLLSSIIELFEEIPRTLLKEHYRCHPKIIEFCNKKFYNNELIILSEIISDKKPLIVYRTVAGNHSRNNINQRQIDVIKNEIIPNEKLCTTDDSLGIVTPYRNQTNELQKQFQGTGVKADTVDKFQGQENKVIILSTVDNKITNFADNPNRLNVAISRAIEQLIVVINGNEIQTDTNINELVSYIEYNNCEVKQSKIFSVFDLLYKCYAKKRKVFLKKHNKISEYDSENIMYALLEDILKKYHSYDVAVHVPVNMIIRDYSLMTEQERIFARNDWTHVDFLIYKTIDKSPILAIEVDGAKYHEKNTKQFERDELKNDIFNKYKIPLYRFSTTESNEKERLSNILKKII